MTKGCEEWGELTCLQTKLQVVFGDDEYGHGFDKKKESKGNAEWTLASLLQLEIMGRQGKKGLAVGGEVKESHPQKNDGTESQPLCRCVAFQYQIKGEYVSEIKLMQNIWNELTNSYSPHKEHYLHMWQTPLWVLRLLILHKTLILSMCGHIMCGKIPAAEILMGFFSANAYLQCFRL